MRPFTSGTNECKNKGKLSRHNILCSTLILSHLNPSNARFKKVSRQIWQTHIDCGRGHRGSFEFQFGVAGKAIRKERGKKKCKVAKGKSATSPITHRGESFVSVWGALIPLFFNCLLYKRTKYWFRPLYTISGECRAWNKNVSESLSIKSQKRSDNTYITSQRQSPLKKKKSTFYCAKLKQK